MPDPFALKEKDVTRQVRDFLSWNQWRPFRNQVSTVQNAAGGWFSSGEKGMPDYLFVRYLPDKPALALNLWVEMKKPGEDLRPHQIEWHRLERLRGAFILVADDYEAFRDEYYKTFSWLHNNDQPLFQNPDEQQQQSTS